MKIINTFFMMILMALSSCQVVTLTDETANAFVVTASQGTTTDNSIEVKWIKTEFYANFVVLRSTSENGTYTPITHRIDAAEYIDTYNIIEGVVYHYKVQGYNDIGTATYITEPAEGFAGSGGGFFPPKNITISTGQSTLSLELAWERAAGAWAYRIYRSEDNSYFSEIGETEILQYEDTTVVAGKTYYYKITSLNKDGDPSPNRSQAVAGTLFGTDLGLSSPAGEYTDRIELTWKKYEYATRYLIFRSGSSDATGDLVKTVDKTEVTKYTDTNVEFGELYYYTIMYQNDSGTLEKSETIRSYLQTAGTPGKPTGFTVSQGADPNDVLLEWAAVEGANSYEIARSVSQTGPWKIIKTTVTDSGVTTHKDRVPNDSYTYFYTVTGLNPAPGTVSDIKEGWANKAPINITASDSFGEKVELAWDKVPHARSYAVSFSETIDGIYTSAGTVYPSGTGRISYEHIYDIGSNLSKEIFYKVQVVTTTSGSSLPSAPVLGMIKKIGAPQNISVRNNKTATRSMTINWDKVPNAYSYNVYRATLSHRGSDPNNLVVGHFTKIGSSEENAFGLDFNTYPIRRYVYMVKAVDGGGAEGVFAKTDVVWRYPADLVDFARDVDFTIVQAQTQVRNFGNNPSSGVISGRAQGNYDYKAGTFGSKNIWNTYSSFEVILNGPQTVSVDISNFSAKLNGPAHISGLYSGTITYNNLNAKEGGFVFAGSMTIQYNHPTKGSISDTWDYNEAAGYLNSVVLKDVESPPGKPSYEAGNG